MSKNDLTFHEWYGQMDALGCSNDPIVHQSKKIDVQELSQMDAGSASIKGIRIMYYDGFKKKWVSGTPLSMLKERRRPEKKVITPEQVIAAADCSLESDNRHSESANRIWESIEKYIPKRRRLAAAKALAEGLECDWKTYINNVS